MINLRTRSLQKELLDADHIPFADIRQNMQELNVVNTRLGGHRISITAIEQLLETSGLTDITICEIGCGGGDNLAAISKWCLKHQLRPTFIGIDIKPECIDFAKEQNQTLQASWIVSDFRDVVFQDKPTIIFSSLFCHHFSNGEITPMLQWMHENCSLGFFINDLHRHRLAYYSIKIMTAMFSQSYLVRHDAPLSVARGFKRKDWEQLMQAAGLEKYTITWKWAFRFLLICRK